MSQESANLTPETYQTANFVDKAHYLSQAFANAEAEYLWPRVWQVACREEEIPAPGNYVVYDIVDESIIVTRGADGEIRAFHNVCPHRGRRIVGRAGTAREFVCGYHGWRWNLDGQNTKVVDRHDWQGCLGEADVNLKTVKVAIWGGFVFINMDLNCEPLETFLAPVIERCDAFEFEKLRFRWYKTVEFPANWKVMLEGFNEAYHVQQTHPQFLEFLEDYSNSGSFGPHSAFWYPPLPDGKSRFGVSSRLDKPTDPDARKYVLAYQKEMHEQLGAMVTPRSFEAGQRLLSEVAEDAPSGEVLMKLRQFQIEAAMADGAGWPELDAEYIRNSFQDWHVFPNVVYLHSSVDGVLCYRSRPHGRNPDRCVFDVWSLMRYAPGEEPPLEREYHAEHRGVKWGRVLEQDFVNLIEVQRGMKSRAFKGSLTNPVQEQAVSNFHRTLREFVAAGAKPGA